MAINGSGIPNGTSHSNGSSSAHGSAGHTNGTNGANGYHKKQASSTSPMPIAVVGMACRFAGGATSAEKLWDLCASGRDAWSRIPESRFDVESFYDANSEKPGRNHATGGYFLQEDVGLFDAGFFNFTGEVAGTMDPQLRLLLEVVYEATEDDTGCSAALAALHQGCQTIRTGESDISIIGASNTILNPDIYIAMSSLGMVGADGRCYAWDSRAQGYGRGEGVAVIVLKSLEAALRDGDRVHAVIRNSGLNQDDTYRRAGLDISDTGYVEAHMTGTKAGDATEAESLARTFGSSRTSGDPVWIGSVKTNVGHTEGVSGLAGIIKAAMAMKYKSIPPNLNYITGNSKIPLKDWNLQVPTNLVSWPSDKPLRASINNFGYGGTNAHVILEGAPEQGLKYRSEGNSDGITADDVSRLYILSAQDSATVKTLAKNLAIHLGDIESEAKPSAVDLAFTLAERRSRLSWITAVRARNLDELALRLEEESAIKVSHLPTNKQAPRLGFVFNGQGAQWHAMGRELIQAYPIFDAAIEKADVALKGHGADWSLREELMRDAKSTRVSEIHLGQPITVALQICLVILLRSWGISPSAVTSHSSGEIAAAYAAGALSFEQALGVTYWRGELARTLLDQKNSGVVGSMAAGGLGPDEAEKYVANTSAGGRVVVACVNSPQSVTLSGDVDDLDEVIARLEADGKFARKLKVPLAYHSHHMLLMASAYTEKLREIVPQKPEWSSDIIYTSPVTGGIITSPEALTPDHYVHNLTSPVLFSQAFESMCFGPDGKSQAQVDIIVEIGPHSTLAGPIRQILQNRKMAYVSCLKRPVDAVATMQDLAGDLLRLGYPVSLGAINHYTNDESTEAMPRFVPDLPTYPWNHATRYWVESRVNQDIRHKKFPPHELLGLPISGAVTPSWRNFLRLTDLPWAADHRVDGAVVLPGAAYISMAIEAIRLITDPSEKSIRGYRVREVEFLSALTIPEASSSSGGVETHLRLHPCHENGYLGWHKFDIRSLGANGVWVENSHGFVKAVSDTDEVEDAVIPDEATFLVAQKFAGQKVNRIQEINGATLREHVAEMGIEYGPTFQGVTNGRASKANSRAITHLDISSLDLDAEDTVSKQPHTLTSYVIHPTTLDCVVQASYSNLPQGTGKTSMVLPRSMQGLFVPRSLHRQAGKSLVAFSELRDAAQKGFTSNLSVINGEADGNGSALLEIDNLFCQAIPRAIDSGPDILLSETRWVPDISYDIPASVKDGIRITLSDEEIDREKKLLRATYYLISDALAALESQSSDSWTPHRLALFNWMKKVIALGKSGQLAPGSKVWARASKGVKQVLFDELKATKASSGNLLVRIGQKLTDIIRGDIDVIDVLQADESSNLQTQFYHGLPSTESRSNKQLARLIQLFGIKNPGLKVLELNAGTGGLARSVLEALEHDGIGGNLIGKYIFTDASDALFDIARQKLNSWTSVLDFQELDIGNEDSVSANLGDQSVDLVIVSTPLYATNDVQQKLNNIRKLLKPSGKLLFIEPTHDRLDAQLVLGTLPGWEENGEPTFATKVQDLDDLLRMNGFTGAEFSIIDCEQPQYERASVILTTVAATQDVFDESSSVNISIIVDSMASSSQPWLLQLVQAIQAEVRIQPVIESIHEVQLDENKAIILAVDATIDKTVLDKLDETIFDKLKSILLSSPYTLWLTNGGLDGPEPASAQVQGLLRTARQEDASKPYVLLDLPHGWTSTPEKSIRQISHVFQQTFSARDGNTIDIDSEYAVIQSVLHIPRIYPISSDAKDKFEFEESLSFQQPDRVLVWEPSAPKGPSFVEDVTDAAVDILNGFVEVETKAFGLNHHDALNSNEGKNPGVYEISGIITRLGQFTNASGLQVGDAVCGVAKGSFSNKTQVAWSSVTKLPESLSLEDAAAVPIAFVAAHHALVHIARVQKGDKVLITHAADSPDGQALLTIAKQKGLDIFAITNGREAEVQSLTDRYNLSPDRILPRQDKRGLVESIISQTGGKGVNVVVSSPNIALSDFILRYAPEVVSHFGHFIHVGDSATSSDTALLNARCVQYARFNVAQLAEYNSQLMRESLQESLHIISHGPSISKQPIASVTRLPISQLNEALQQAKQTKGIDRNKIVIVSQSGDLVKVTSRARPLSLDNKKATYLVVGGVSGISGAIISWMISKGAKNIVAVSRNVEGNPNAVSLIQDAEERGCNLQLRNCDVSSEDGFAKFLQQISTSLPPIRGVVHAAAVLEDTVLERMTLAQWRHAVEPKVAGTRNLHKHLPKDLSFFVLLSSITGVVGHSSQANYAAANTFEDALARHRVAEGLPATSIDLPAIRGVGMVAEDDDAHRRIEALGTESLSIDSVLGILEAAIERDTDTQQRRSGKARLPHEAQVIAGLLPWSLLAPEANVTRDRRFGTLRLARSSSSSAASSDDTVMDPTALLVQGLNIKKSGAPMEEAKEKVAGGIAARLAAIFNVPVESIDLGTAISAHGVDSLVAVELRNWLAAASKAKLSIFDIMQSSSLREFAGLVVERSALSK
ncbi:lovastatin diketide synthase [Trichoderma arundinaceum]|uniref:Lovastatin diketide synthase n=1 Tax=Trichoderma arundinaceum TaxID=490622 RepID=A0A395NQ71_TRIAR|nr:lovastatin diketide synthase [Trichoderma arundinaceum]